MPPSSGVAPALVSGPGTLAIEPLDQLDDSVADDYDLEQRRFLVTGLDNDYRAPRFREEADPKEFSPNALLYYVR